MQAVSLSNALFSKVQQRVLALIFGHPDRSFYTQEIVKRLNSGTGAVERELFRLEHSGLVSVKRIGNQKHYQANRDSPIFEELQNLVVKTVALTQPLRQALDTYADTISSAFVYGSVAKGEDTARSDVDIIVIGDGLDYAGMYEALEQVSRRLRRTVKPLFLSPEEWRQKIAAQSFLAKVQKGPKIFIYGSESDLDP